MDVVTAAGCAGGCSALVLLTGNNMQSLLHIIDGVLQHIGYKGKNRLIM